MCKLDFCGKWCVFSVEVDTPCGVWVETPRADVSTLRLAAFGERVQGDG